MSAFDAMRPALVPDAVAARAALDDDEPETPVAHFWDHHGVALAEVVSAVVQTDGPGIRR